MVTLSGHKVKTKPNTRGGKKETQVSQAQIKEGSWNCDIKKNKNGQKKVHL